MEADTGFYLPDYLMYSLASKRARETGIPAWAFLQQGRGPGKLLIAHSESEVRDLVGLTDGKRAYKPEEAVYLTGPDGVSPVIVVGDGETEMAQIQDIAQAIYERDKATIVKGGDPFQFEEYRAQQGIPSRKEMDARFRQGIADKAQRLKRSHRTQPSRRQRRYQRSLWSADSHSHKETAIA